MAITVDHEEMEGSPTESWDESGFRATRKLLCAWSDRITLASQMRSGLGEAYPHFVSARAKHVTIAPFGADRNTNPSSEAVYEKAVVTVEYRTGEGGTLPDPESEEVREESLEPNIEAFRIGAFGLFWSNGDEVQEDEAPSKIFPSLDIVVRRLKMATIPAAVFELAGHVNQSSVSFSQLGLTAAAETLLYNPPVLERTILSDGSTQGWNLTQRFSYRPNGWNKFWRRNQWMEIEDAYEGGTIVKPYPPSSFAAL